MRVIKMPGVCRLRPPPTTYLSPATETHFVPRAHQLLSRRLHWAACLHPGCVGPGWASGPQDAWHCCGGGGVLSLDWNLPEFRCSAVMAPGPGDVSGILFSSLPHGRRLVTAFAPSSLGGRCPHRKRL